MTPEEIAAKEAADAAAAEAANEPPAWAQQILDQNADITSRLDSFTPAPVAPPVTTTPPAGDESWTPQSWDDVDARAKELARSEAQAILDQREADQKAATDAQAAAAAEIDTLLDNQVAELTKNNALPAVVNENDPNDPGKLAQRELYGFALSLGTADLKTSFNTLDALHKAGKQFDFVKMELVDKNPASLGTQSPVGSSNSGASGVTTRPDYKTIHANSLDALAARFGQ